MIGLDALIRSIGINRATSHALLIGAGASITSGVPSAASCIWEWKRAIFLTKNPGLEAQFAELSLPAVRSKIQRWLDALAFGPEVRRVLSKCHDMRNRTEYEGVLDVDDRLVSDLIAACRKVAEKVRSLRRLLCRRISSLCPLHVLVGFKTWLSLISRP